MLTGVIQVTLFVLIVFVSIDITFWIAWFPFFEWLEAASGLSAVAAWFVSNLIFSVLCGLGCGICAATLPALFRVWDGWDRFMGVFWAPVLNVVFNTRNGWRFGNIHTSISGVFGSNLEHNAGMRYWDWAYTRVMDPKKLDCNTTHCRHAYETELRKGYYGGHAHRRSGTAVIKPQKAGI